MLASVGRGAFAEEVVTEADGVHRIPDSMDFVTAAGFPVAYSTSLRRLCLARPAAGPASGCWCSAPRAASALTAVEIAKAMGAKVIAAAGGADKLAVAKRAGADHLIDYSREEIRDRVKDITGGRGVDVVYDPVGGDAFDASLRSIAWEGRIIVIGFAGGRVPQIPANLVLVKNIDIIGFFWGSYRRTSRSSWPSPSRSSSAGSRRASSSRMSRTRWISARWRKPSTCSRRANPPARSCSPWDGERPAATAEKTR